MTLSPDFIPKAPAQDSATFWERLFAQHDLRECAPLEKLLVGCELIAALDEAELLAA